METREFNEIRNNIDGVVGGGVTDLYVSTGMWSVEQKIGWQFDQVEGSKDSVLAKIYFVLTIS